MKFEDIPSGSSVFLDANVFVYDFGPDPQFGIPSQNLLERIELGDLRGFCSTHELSNVAHRLMTLEACQTFGWPYAGIGQRLRTIPRTSPGSIAFDAPWTKSWPSESESSR